LLLLLLLLPLLLPGVPKAPAPHHDVGDWWALYDYGLEAVSAWRGDYQHPYPGENIIIKQVNDVSVTVWGA
jgi:hypothetical protein